MVQENARLTPRRTEEGPEAALGILQEDLVEVHMMAHMMAHILSCIDQEDQEAGPEGRCIRHSHPEVQVEDWKAHQKC